MKFYYVIITCSFCFVKTFSQTVLSPSISKAKQTEKQRLLKAIDEAFKKPIADSTYSQYQTAFWAMMLLENKPKNALPKIKSALKNFADYDNEFQNALLEVVYSQYPKELEKEVSILIKDTLLTAKQFAVCGEYLIKNKNYIKEVHTLKQAKIQNAFKKMDQKLILYYTSLMPFHPHLSQRKEPPYQYAQEIIESIVKNEYFANKPVLISLQNKNRNYPGIVIIKKPNGNVLTLNDTIFYTQQLTRAITNLPYYISNGNTPQGIFRIDGLGVSSNSHIGPTENFQLCMPFECKVKDFFDEPIADSIWNDSILDRILPPKMSPDYAFLFESTIAGKLGRFEIIAHGSTVNTNYYTGKQYYGFTPTMGCLQAREIWDYTTGKRIYSDQQKLIDAYKSMGAEKGYLIVLDIINANRPVNINDLKKLLK